MTTALPETADAKRAVDDKFRVNVDWLQEKEDQIRALGESIADLWTRDFIGCRPVADPAGSALQPGTVVALKGGSGASAVMVPATAANFAAGAVLLGLLVQTTPQGSRGLVAISGIVPTKYTGLTSPGLVGADATTGLATVGAPVGIIGISRADGVVSIQVPPPQQEGQQLIDMVNADKTIQLNPGVRLLVVYSSVTLSATRILTLTGVAPGRMIHLINLTQSHPEALNISPVTTGGAGDLSGAGQWVCTYADMTSLGDGPGWFTGGLS